MSIASFGDEVGPWERGRRCAGSGEGWACSSEVMDLLARPRSARTLASLIYCLHAHRARKGRIKRGRDFAIVVRERRGRGRDEGSALERCAGPVHERVGPWRGREHRWWHSRPALCRVERAVEALNERKGRAGGGDGGGGKMGGLYVRGAGCIRGSLCALCTIPLEPCRAKKGSELSDSLRAHGQDGRVEVAHAARDRKWSSFDRKSSIARRSLPKLLEASCC